MITTCLHEYRYAGYLCEEEKSANNAKRLMKLDYYLHESEYSPGAESEPQEPGFWSDEISYGFRVTKTEVDAFEEARVEYVTVGYDKAKELLRILAENKVTPCCLCDVLEDICINDYSF